FIVFDIEIIFLYPWTAIYRRLGAHGLFAMLLFSVPIIVSLAYEFSRGALDWGPLRKDLARASGMVSEDRTLTSTVRRVGLDGREQAPTTEAA
ncbi:MAG: NAD(P)H-quinone oxidoreductase subunit 3, partial [Acidimicrobiia bacterium]|nr:NAD(P)H-quinone oxidoreductase subunit 3 [Acidimicrobiia bacterium]